MSTDHKEIVRQLLVDELQGKSFRRQAEFLTDQLVHERFMAGQSLAVAKEEMRLRYAEENRVLDTHLTEYQNLEGAVCPPGMDFKSYFEQLEKRVAELEAVKSDLLGMIDRKQEKIEKLTEENAQLTRRAEACEQSKKESTPTPTPPKPEPEPEPKPEPEQENDVEDEEPTEEPESCTESETASEDGLFTEEEWRDIVAEKAEESKDASEAVKAMVAVIQEGGLPSQSAEKLDFQALLDEALKG